MCKPNRNVEKGKMCKSMFVLEISESEFAE